MMSSLSGLLELANRKTVRYAAGAFLVFLTGYLLFFGRAAGISGSWQYVMRTTDDFFYWASAKGVTETPMCEANPYYFEESGKRHGVPYPVVTLVGHLAKILGVSVLFFYPIWHIGMPFVLWLTLYLCFVKFWRYPQLPSAALAMIFLLSTLFLCDVSHETLFRFSRPGDGLWLLLIWLSAALNGCGRGRRTTLLLCVVAFLLLWINPFLFVLGVQVTFLELIWQGLKAKEERRAFFLGALLISGVFAVLCYGGYVHLMMDKNVEEAKRLVQSSLINLRRPETESIVLYVLMGGLVFLNRFLFHRGLTRLDRFVLFLFLIEPLLGNLQVIFPEELLRSYFKYSMTSELAYHRYSYAVIEIAAMTGWFIEKMPLFLNGRLWEKTERWLMAATGLALAGILLNPATSFFRYAPHVMPPYGMTNPKLLLTLLPFVFLTVWFFYRFQNVRRVMSDRRFVVAVIIGMTLSGYPLLAGQSYDPKTHFYNFRDYPFGGAYQWLNHNAKKNEVVLTVPPSRLDFDYLIFYTDLKDYINPYGSRLAERHARNDNTFRFLFYFNLLLDDFRGFESEGVTRVEDKLKKLRIDYVLIEMPSPFLPHVVEQLQGHFVPAYRDSKCLLLKVT